MASVRVGRRRVSPMGYLKVSRSISSLCTRSTAATVRRMVFLESSVYPDSMDLAISCKCPPCQTFCITGFISVATRTMTTRSFPG